MDLTLARFPRGTLIGAAICTLATLAAAQERPATHIVPFFPAASDTRPQGVVRIVNLADESGTVDVVAIDAAGVRYEGTRLAIGTGNTAHFDSDDLESGDPDTGLAGGTGPGQGDWRLELTSDLAVEVQAYVRAPGGAFAEMRETAGRDGDRFRIPIFNPGHNVNQVGLLWLFNRGDEPVTVRVRGTDDRGRSPGTGVAVELGARGAGTYTAAELESGVAPGLAGSLGDGVGKWRLDGEADGPVAAMSLVSSPTGHLTNLSTVPARESGGVHRVPLFPPASDAFGRQGFARVVNRSAVAGEVRIEAFDGTEWSYEAVTLAIGANETAHFNSNDLELGNPAKGLTGSTGAGEGDWRLELTSGLDVEVLSYVRTVGGRGYVTPMHDTAARERGGLVRYYVPLFHAAAYEGQESRLHLFNPGAAKARVGIAGVDDGGAASAGDVSLVLGPGETRVVTARELEGGGDGLDGRLVASDGRWRLFVASDVALQVMSLGYDADGYLFNLSRARPPASAAEVAAPDLVVEAPSVDDDAPVAGGSFVLSTTVRNRGGADTEATILRYHRSTNAHISASDTQVATDRVGALSASGSGDESVTLTAPPAGTYYYGACVDAVPGESDTANNCSSSVAVRVTVPVARPDLAVVSPSVSDVRPGAGGTFTFSATVRNVGDSTAASTTLRYHRSANATITTTDTQVGADAVDELAASGSSAESIALTAPPTSGTYYYGACVDAVEGESDTTDNCSSPARVDVAEPTAPDLKVGTPTVDDASPETGGSFTLSATVTNAGDGAASATTLRYHRSANATITTTDTQVGADAVDELAASGSSAESIALTAPPTSGTYYYGACVDAVEGESDTTDNCSSPARVDVAEPTAPDLKVGTPTVDDASPETGGSFTLSATVTNAGDGAASATTLRYHRSAGPTITTADTQVGTDAVDGLAASGSSAESIALTAPPTSGTYYYGACVDAVEGESDTTDNCSSPARVDVAEPTAPDLKVGTPTVDDASPETGGSFTLSATVTNAGDGAASATTLRYHRSAGPTITTADTQVGTDAVDGLAASGSSAESIALTAPPTSGTYYYGACVDAVEGESDTTDNCSSPVGVDVAEPTSPDLEVGTPTVDDASPETGGSFTLSATVTNAGDGAASATTLRYYRSLGRAITTANRQVGTDAVDGLAASGMSPESISLTAPSTAWTYYYGACVDAVSNESNTENNCSAATQLTVSWPPPPTGYDLAVHNVALNTEAPKPSEDITFTVTIRNKGNVASTERVVTYYRWLGTTNACRSPNPTISVKVGEDRIDTLSAGAEREYTVTFTTGIHAIPFTFAVNMEPDPNDLNARNEVLCTTVVVSE